MLLFSSAYNEYTVIPKEYTGPLYFDITGVTVFSSAYNEYTVIPKEYTGVFSLVLRYNGS